MKAFLLSVSLLALGAMGASLYYFFQHAPEYQAASAQRMKDSFLENGRVAVPVTGETTWTFSDQPADWSFEVKGSLLEIRPPAPEPLPRLEAGQNIQDLPEWPAVRQSLVEEVRERLKIDSKSTAELEILPPVPRVAR